MNPSDISPYLYYSKDEVPKLFIESVNSETISKIYGTPVYAYSKAHILEQLQLYQQGFGSRKHQIHYSVKVNPNIHILRLLAQHGAGFDVVSQGELQRVLMAKGDPQKIVFSGIGKSTEEINFAIQKNIACINAESFAEIQRIADCAKKQQRVVGIGIRVNPNIDAKTHPYISTGLKNNKFGIPIAEILELYEWTAKNPWLDPSSLSCHIGSQLLDISPLILAMQSVTDLIQQLSAKSINLQHINLGGGIGIHYQQQDLEQTIDWHQYFQKILTLIDAKYKILLEPGRSIIGNAGILISQVEYLKQMNDNSFAIIDAAMNDLIRPALYQAYHEIIPCQLTKKGITAAWKFVGPICESADCFGKDRHLTLTQASTVAILSAGAYGFCLSSNYNSRNKVAEVLIDGDKHRLIRQRETLDNQLISEKSIQFE